MSKQKKIALSVFFGFFALIFFILLYTINNQTPSPQSRAAPPHHSIGYIGCSSTPLTVLGYHEASGSADAFWPVDLSRNVSTTPSTQPVTTSPAPSGSDQVDPFKAMIDKFGQPRVVWVQLCNERADNPLTYTVVKNIFDKVNRLAPKAITYVSPINSYDPKTLCPRLGKDGSGYDNLVSLANQAVSDSLALPGPGLSSGNVLGPLTQTMVQKDNACYPNGDGRQTLGKQMIAFFDSLVGPSKPPSQGNAPFGLFFDNNAVLFQKQLDIAKLLGVNLLRPKGVIIQQWDGTCTECDQAKTNGVRFALTIQNENFIASGTPTPKPTKTLTKTPKPTTTQAQSSAGAQNQLNKILDVYAPALLVVENTEDKADSFSGNAQDYAQELKGACTLAHSKQIRCTNGGLSGPGAVLLTYQNFVDTGQCDKAAKFREKAFSNNQLQLTDREIEKEAVDLKKFIRAYTESDIDFVNVHWHGKNSEILKEILKYLITATGLEVVTNEVGQNDRDPKTTTEILTVLRNAKMRYAVWDNHDNSLNYALINPDGTLRSTGTAFKDFIASSGKTTPGPSRNPSRNPSLRPTKPVPSTGTVTPTNGPKCRITTPTPSCKPGDKKCGPSPSITPPSTSPTISPNPSGSPTPQRGDVTLNLKIKFQGVVKQPTGITSIPVLVTLRSPGVSSDSAKTTNVTSDVNGVWSGAVSFQNVPLGGGHTVLIKGPKHVQKKLCDNISVETAPGTYSCSLGKINLVSGNNVLDFSGVVELVGDLPQQDGIIDSYDISFIRNNLGKSDPSVLATGDLNYDGILDSQDYSLLIASLSVRKDEE